MDEEKLVLFTLNYPYGKGEAFLENEIKQLSSNFDTVYILPTEKGSKEKRFFELDDNVVVLDDLINGNASIITLLLSNFIDCARIYFYQLTTKHRWKYIRYFKSFCDYLSQDIRKKKIVRSIIKKHKLEHAIFYDYWFVNSTITLALLRKEGIVKKCFSRAHGFDLYDDRQFEKVVSFREFKVKYLDAVFAISHHGLDYLKRRCNKKHHYKLKLSYLGVDLKVNRIDENASSDELVIVSCARLIDFKRVHIIPDLLNALHHLKIRWIHFGDGAMNSVLMEKTKLLKPHITFDFRGEVQNSEVHEFYESNKVDFFISLSQSEGLPVSMMEAQAFGIPIISTIVNGVGEIVNENTGIPLSLKLSVDEIGLAINNNLNKKFVRERIKKHFQDHFNASYNYSCFIKTIKALNEPVI